MPVSTSVRVVRGWRLRLRRELAYSDRAALVALSVLALALVATAVAWPMVVPVSVMVLPMFVGNLWLGPRTLPWYVIGCLLGVCVMVGASPVVDLRTVIRIVVTFGVGLLIVVTSFRLGRLGVSAPRSESMFIDLRDRITKQGHLPGLPADWYVEAETRSAGGTAFAGDFLVANNDIEGRTVDLVVVDVSGKGVEAGTRALLLSGAFGGLLSALPPDQFLPAASAFLLRQDWEEGFATAIHLHLDLTTATFELRKAGHPPAIWLQAGSGTWRVLDSDGPVLGLMADASFELVTGRLQPGDALMLYTDGLVESTRRDLHSGIDKLAGRGQLLMRRGFVGGARWVVEELGVANDDQALVLVHRR